VINVPSELTGVSLSGLRTKTVILVGLVSLVRQLSPTKLVIVEKFFKKML
jgi:hypothetical protein